METYWIDSHSHLNDEQFRNEFDRYIENAIDRNVKRINLIALNREQLEFSFAAKEKYPLLDISFGYHPEDADKINEDDITYLKQIVSDERIIAIGEIGLDYYWVDDNKEKQKELFITQIEIANQKKKPIIIHSRSAADDTYDILKKHAGTDVMMHCFGENEQMLMKYLALDYYISFTGTLTFKKSDDVRNNACLTPIDRIMIETDCPYMTPVPYRGSQNESSYVYLVGEKLAEIRQIESQQLQRQLMENYERFFHGKN